MTHHPSQNETRTTSHSPNVLALCGVVHHMDTMPNIPQVAEAERIAEIKAKLDKVDLETINYILSQYGIQPL